MKMRSSFKHSIMAGAAILGALSVFPVSALAEDAGSCRTLSEADLAGALERSGSVLSDLVSEVGDQVKEMSKASFPKAEAAKRASLLQASREFVSELSDLDISGPESLVKARRLAVRLSASQLKGDDARGGSFPEGDEKIGAGLARFLGSTHPVLSHFNCLYLRGQARMRADSTHGQDLRNGQRSGTCFIGPVAPMFGQAQGMGDSVNRGLRACLDADLGKACVPQAAAQPSGPTISCVSPQPATVASQTKAVADEIPVVRVEDLPDAPLSSGSAE
jgi:hypothetical protein